MSESPITAQQAPYVARVGAGLPKLLLDPYMEGLLSAHHLVRSRPVLEAEPIDVEVLFGVGCVHESGVSEGVPVEWLQMYFGALRLMRLFSLPTKSVTCLIGFDIAKHNPAVQNLGGKHPKLTRTAAWHMANIEHINDLVASGNYPNLRPIERYLDLEHVGDPLMRKLEKERRAIRLGTNRYSSTQDVLVRYWLERIRERNARAVLLKCGWAVRDSITAYEETELKHRLTEGSEHEGGGDEVVFDNRTNEWGEMHYGRHKFPLGTFYTRGPRTLSSEGPLGCPYTAKMLPSGRHGRILLHREAHGADALLANLRAARDTFETERAHERRQRLTDGMESLSNLVAMINDECPGLVNTAPDLETEILSIESMIEGHRREAASETLGKRQRQLAAEKANREGLELFKLRLQLVEIQVPSLLNRFAPSDGDITRNVRQLESRFPFLTKIKETGNGE